MAKQQMHGLAVRESALEITTLEENQQVWTVAGHSARRLGGVAGDMTDALGRALSPPEEPLRGACAVAVPASELLLRVLDLPSDDLDEIAGMVELQVDKVSPFPVDQMVIGIETLSRQEGSSRVLIAGAQQEKIDAIGDAVREAGGFPKHIDVDLIVWLGLLHEAKGIRRHGRSLVLLMEARDTVLVIAEHGIPVMVRSLGGPDDQGADAYAELLADEVEYTLTTMETEWGGESVLGADIWHAGPAPPAVPERIGEVCGVEVETHDLGTLPRLSEGVARRALAGDADGLNLAPPGWAVTEASRKARGMVLRAGAVVLLAWLVTVSVFLLALAGKRGDLEERAAFLNSLEEPAAEVREIRDRVQFLERYTDRTYSVLEHLREVTLALPAGVDLSGMTFTRNGFVSLKGISADRNPIFEFNEALQQSELLRDVKLGNVRVIKGRNTFSLKAQSAEAVP